MIQRHSFGTFQYHFRIRRCFECNLLLADQLCLQFPIIIDLAIEYDGKIVFLCWGWLAASLQVDDRQALMGKGQVPVVPDGLVVWPAVLLESCWPRPPVQHCL